MCPLTRLQSAAQLDLECMGDPVGFLMSSEGLGAPRRGQALEFFILEVPEFRGGGKSSLGHQDCRLKAGHWTVAPGYAAALFWET